MIRIIGPRDKRNSGELVLNVTSSSLNESTRLLSPFFLGPVTLYQGHTSQNVENAWQYSKCYTHHLGKDGNPNESYWRWAKSGWEKKWADRYPAGKGAIPAFSFWDGKKLNYIEARKQIYVPLYSQACEETPQFKMLQQTYFENGKITLFDFDGYDYLKLGMTFEDVLTCETRKMGHAFVLAMLLAKDQLKK